MDNRNYIHPQKQLQVKFKPLMTRELEKIAEREGVSDPRALVLLEIAKLIREKKESYKSKGIII